jgi:hypothetical protein
MAVVEAADGGVVDTSSVAVAGANADLAMPLPATAGPAGNARAPRADKDFAGWVS